VITTFAGNGTYGYSGDAGPAISAQLAWAIGITIDKAGNVYIADHDNNVIRKINNAGIISTYGGTRLLGYSGDGGPAISAKLYHPAFISVDITGSLFFTDQNGEVVRKISASGIITSITGNLPAGYSGDGGPVRLAQFRSITGVTPDNAGNLYITDGSNHALRTVNAAGIITTVAGNGTAGFNGDGGAAVGSQLKNPYQVILDKGGNIYIPDAGNNRIRKINTSGTINTFAGNGTGGNTGDGGPASAASLNFPWNCAIDTGSNIFISEPFSLVVRKISPTGIITTYAGNGTFGYTGDGGPAVIATLADICGVAVDEPGNLYIVNRTPYYVVRKVSNCLTAAITMQPLNSTLCSSGSANFTVSATNALTYQWQVNSGTSWNNLVDNTIYTGTSTNSLNISGATSLNNGYKYRCMVTNACASIFSSAGILNVTTPSTPSVTIQTPFATVCSGTNVIFSAAEQNAGSSPSFQWKKNGNDVGTNSRVYTDNTLNTGDIITCILTSNNSCVTTNTAQSNPVAITVNLLLTPSYPQLHLQIIFVLEPLSPSLPLLTMAVHLLHIGGLKME